MLRTKKLSEKQRIHQISQLIKQDIVNLKKRKVTEPNTAEVICTPQDIFHTPKRKK